MSGFFLLGWGRKLAGGLGFVSLSWVVFQIWGSIVLHLPEYTKLFDHIRQCEKTGVVLLERENSIQDRILLKRKLCEDLQKGSLSWQVALETYSWLNQTSQVPDPALLGNAFPGPKMENLALSLANWSSTTDIEESEIRQCELVHSFFENQKDLVTIKPNFHANIVQGHTPQGVEHQKP